MSKPHIIIQGHVPRKLHSPLSNRTSSDPSAHVSRPRTPIDSTSFTGISSPSPSNVRRQTSSNAWISARFESNSPAELSRFVESSLIAEMVAECAQSTCFTSAVFLFSAQVLWPY
jgi:hypothetical protein